MELDNLSAIKEPLRIGKLRVLTNKECNYFCLYCHREGQFSPRFSITHEERKGLIKIATQFGLDEIKYSGGEPLLYRGIIDLVRYSKSLGIPKVSLTTNGSHLEDKLKSLKDAGLDELSISLDTINLNTFKFLNNGTTSDFEKTFRAINKLEDYKFNQVNLNMVLTKYNFCELEEMRNFSKKLRMPLRLISFISLLGLKSRSLSVDTFSILNGLKEKSVKIFSEENSPAYTKLDMGEGEILELVDSSCLSCVNCGKSYALRLTVDGKLKPCLISEQGEVDVITSYKRGDQEELARRFNQAIAIKKLGILELFNTPRNSLSKEYLNE
jgi:cyclic pyranopterin phosphate synthase